MPLIDAAGPKSHQSRSDVEQWHDPGEGRIPRMAEPTCITKASYARNRADSTTQRRLAGFDEIYAAVRAFMVRNKDRWKVTSRWTNRCAVPLPRLDDRRRQPVLRVPKVSG